MADFDKDVAPQEPTVRAVKPRGQQIRLVFIALAIAAVIALTIAVIGLLWTGAAMSIGL